MESFKIDNAEGDFPEYSEVSQQKVALLTAKLKKELCSRGDFPECIFNLVKNNGEAIYSDIEAHKNSFNLINSLKESTINFKDNVFINWHHFDIGEIDEISLVDLSDFFFDIWYSSSDDIDIFDESCAWLISISHYGEIKYIK